MTLRTTVALDESTVKPLRKLAKAWGVSQSEVVRRAIHDAERRSDLERGNAAGRLDAYLARGGLDRERAASYLAQVAEDRAAWRERR